MSKRNRREHTDVYTGTSLRNTSKRNGRAYKALRKYLVLLAGRADKSKFPIAKSIIGMDNWVSSKDDIVISWNSSVAHLINVLIKVTQHAIFKQNAPRSLTRKDLKFRYAKAYWSGVSINLEKTEDDFR